MILKGIILFSGFAIGYFLGCFVTNIFYRDEEEKREKAYQKQLAKFNKKGREGVKKIIGVNFVGQERFSLADLNEIKERVKKTLLTLKEYKIIMDEIKEKYKVSSKIAFDVTQYCVINRNE